jgi:hypothetical protein
MQYFDPARPRYENGVPKLMVGDSCPGALPAIYLEPFREGTQIIVSVYLPTNRASAFRHYECRISPDSLLVFWSAWMADPEAVLRTQFGWEPEPLKVAPKPRLSPIADSDLLDALGLE